MDVFLTIWMSLAIACQAVHTFWKVGQLYKIRYTLKWSDSDVYSRLGGLLIPMFCGMSWCVYAGSRLDWILLSTGVIESVINCGGLGMVFWYQHQNSQVHLFVSDYTEPFLPPELDVNETPPEVYNSIQSNYTPPW